MTRLNTTPLNTPSVLTPPADADLAEQANPGHGIPSQDPEAAAQTGIEPHEAAREGQSVLVGGAMVAGAATGAAIGVVVAGPVGSLAGAALGAVVGAAGGAAAGTAASSAAATDSVDEAPAVPARPAA